MEDVNAQPPEGEVEEVETTEEVTEPEGEEETEEVETEVEEEVPEPTVSLSKYSNAKELLSRFAEDLLNDEDKLADYAESDPKALKRLMAEFPKKFKGVDIPTKTMSDDDIEERIAQAVEKRLAQSTRAEKLDNFRRELKMSEIEFEDIKDDVEAKADQLLKAEIAGNYSDALIQAYKLIDPVKAKHLMTKQVVKEMSDRSGTATAGTGKSQGGKKEFSESIMKNWKKAGFKSAEEMARYSNMEDGDIPIADHIQN